MIRTILMIGLVLVGFSWKVDGLKQESANVIDASSSTSAAAATLPLCGCDELSRCHGEQVKKERNLISSCRQECASKIFLKPSLQKVVQCFETQDAARADALVKQERCSEEMGSRRCHSPSSPSRPQTVTINTTEFLHSDSSKNKKYKIAYPESISSLNQCVKTCVKNDGTIQFNPDGTVVKPPKVKKDAQVDPNMDNAKKSIKYGKDYNSQCANQLGCQLTPVDKKLDKQVKHLCKLQIGKQDDHEIGLCSCLENALGQKLQCTTTQDPTTTSSGTCSKSSSCPDSRKTESKTASKSEESGNSK